MKTRTALCSLGLLLLCAGCAQRTYVKDGWTAQQFEADRFDCEYKVVGMYGGYGQMGAGHAILARGDMDRCLRSKGYREMSDQPPTPPSGSHLTPEEISRFKSEINPK